MGTKIVPSCFLTVYILYINFCKISFNRIQDQHFPKKSEKNVTTAPPTKLSLQKWYHLSKYAYCKQNVVWFYALESKINLTLAFLEKHNNSVPYSAMCIKINSLLFLIIYILYTNVCAFLFSRIRKQRTPKIP